MPGPLSRRPGRVSAGGYGRPSRTPRGLGRPRRSCVDFLLLIGAFAVRVASILARARIRESMATALRNRYLITMSGVFRYLRILGALARYCFVPELAFRRNFLIKISGEVLWLFILLFFYRTVFTKTSVVADWSEGEYLFFVGCYFALEGVIETLFLDNCNEFADLVRSGDLDFYLLKPIDEQFLITCNKIDWSCAANLLMGLGVMAAGLTQLPDIEITPASVFFFVFMCAVGAA